MTNPISNSKLEDLKEEFKIIQEMISKWDKNSLSIKNWAITVWSIIMVFIGTQYYTQDIVGIDLSYLFYIPIFLPILFWFYDGLFKKFQRFSINRSQAIQDYLNNSLNNLDDNDTERLEKKNKKLNKKLKKETTTIQKEGEDFLLKFPIYDPVGWRSKKHNFFIVKYHKKTNIFACMLVRITAFVYCTLICLSFLVIAIILNFYPILWWSIIPILILLFSWKLSEKRIV